jgi:crossover junction endodeoxyribonuclease RuvC
MTGTIIGIDPGLDGALAFLFRDTLTILDMPTVTIQRGGKNKRELDLAAIVKALDHGLYVPAHAFVEQVGAMPGQGVSSMFSFGKSYGSILGILAAKRIPYTLVPPVRWKRALAVPAGKDAARHRASQLLPAFADLWPLVKHDGRAEAALIAHYGDRTFGAESEAA